MSDMNKKMAERQEHLETKSRPTTGFVIQITKLWS